MRSLGRARLEIVGAALLFSTGGAVIKATSFSGWQLAGLRSLVAAVVVLLLLPAARRGWSWRTLLVAVAYAACLILYVTANKLTTAANTIFLQSTGPIYILLLAPWLLKEKISREDLGVLAVMVVGLLCFFVGADRPLRSAPDPSTGNILAALAGLMWAFVVMGLRWLGRASGPEVADPGMSAVALGNLLAALVALPMGGHLGATTATDWAAVAFLGIVQIGIAYLLMSRAVRVLPAFEASVLLLLEPALNPFWAWLVQGEVPGEWALVGGGLILGASVAKSWWDSRAPVAV
ncbi:MAG: DMT family transporter [Gemmatimonadales bacterium]